MTACGFSVVFSTLIDQNCCIATDPVKTPVIHTIEINPLQTSEYLKEKKKSAWLMPESKTTTH